jgi:hypothetical protein
MCYSLKEEGMAKQKVTSEERQARLGEQIKALMEKQKKLEERDRAEKREKQRALHLELGRMCVSKGFNSADQLARFFLVTTPDMKASDHSIAAIHKENSEESEESNR